MAARSLTQGALGLSAIASTNHIVPFDYRAAETMPGWRSDLAAPFSGPHLAGEFENVVAAILDTVAGFEPEARRASLAAAPTMINFALPAVEMALAISSEAETGISAESPEPEFAYLQGASDSTPPVRGAHVFDRIPRPRLPWRRHAQVTASWTDWWRVPGAMAAPQVVAISENPILVAEARDSGRPISFRHAGSILAGARRLRRGVPIAADADRSAAQLSGSIAKAAGVPEPVRSRLSALLHQQARFSVARAAEDLSALGQMRSLPSEVWSGTGALYPARVIGQEVMRRGGKATRHDHASTLAFAQAPYALNALELAVSTRYVVATEGLASLMSAAASNASHLPPPMAEIGFGHGDPSIAGLPLDSSSRRKKISRRRVVYAPTFLRGFFRHAFSTLPDPVYLDWQLRLAENLGAESSPVDLLCKPHPEGLFARRTHPLSQVAQCSTARFEDVMADAEGYLFDRCTSTSFWRALCTDRPVVFLKIAAPEINENAMAILKRRCTIIEASFDASNLPQVSYSEVRDALASGPDRVDPTEMRTLLMGQYAAGIVPVSR